MRNAEKGRSNQNHKAETEIRELKKRWKTRMIEKKVPKLWDYRIVYMAEIISITARGSNQKPGLEEITGQTIDISEWLHFEFYDSVLRFGLVLGREENGHDGGSRKSRSLARNSSSYWW